jgi:type VI secretion system protein ImpF
MARPIDEEPLRPSVLDLLTGNHSPDQRRRGHQSEAQLRTSVMRDLENLLNTRYRVSAWPPTLQELEHSIVNYGIPDFTGANMSSRNERQLFRQLVEDALRHHEPRFVGVRVEVVEPTDESDRTLRFRIHADLHAVPDPLPVSFDSQVDQATHRIDVKQGRQ